MKTRALIAFETSRLRRRSVATGLYEAGDDLVQSLSARDLSVQVRDPDWEFDLYQRLQYGSSENTFAVRLE